MKHLAYLAILYSSYAFAQNPVVDSIPITKKPTECCDTLITYYSSNNDKSVYTVMQNIWLANEPISYWALPSTKYVNNISLPLREGEGKNGFLFEGNIFNQFTILQGRNQSNHFWQTMKLTFDVGFNFRMAKDSSSPLLPYSDMFGLSFNKKLWDSRTKYGPFTQKLCFAYENWINRSEPLHDVSLDVSLRHYSNGQPVGSSYSGIVDGIIIKRNDYKKGDFSTNYIRVGFTYSFLSSVKRNLYSASLNFQHDGTIAGPLSYLPYQDSTGYGRNRIIGFLQMRHNLFLGAKNSFWDVRCYKNVRLKRIWEIKLRYEYEYILGNLTMYHSANKYRFNQHIYMQFTPLRARTISILLHYYYGRDYMNIRYDTQISLFHFGIGFNFTKYTPPFKNSTLMSKYTAAPLELICP